MQFNGKVHKLSKNKSAGERKKIKKRKHCSGMKPEPEPGKKGCSDGAGGLGSFAGDARRPEACRRGVTRPGANRRRQRSSAEHLEAGRRKAASTVEAEGWAALLEAPRSSDDRRRAIWRPEQRSARRGRRRRRVSGGIDFGRQVAES